MNRRSGAKFCRIENTTLPQGIIRNKPPLTSVVKSFSAHLGKRQQKKRVKYMGMEERGDFGKKRLWKKSKCYM